jgi:hypothetical protein
MNYFAISDEEAKKLLEVFYNSPYKNVLPYVEILHNMREVNEISSFDVTLKEHLEKEVIKLSQVVPAGE